MLGAGLIYGSKKQLDEQNIFGSEFLEVKMKTIFAFIIGLLLVWPLSHAVISYIDRTLFPRIDSDQQNYWQWAASTICVVILVVMFHLGMLILSKVLRG